MSFQFEPARKLTANSLSDLLVASLARLYDKYEGAGEYVSAIVVGPTRIQKTAEARDVRIHERA